MSESEQERQEPSREDTHLLRRPFLLIVVLRERPPLWPMLLLHLRVVSQELLTIA